MSRRQGVSPLVDGLRTTAIVFSCVGAVLAVCICAGMFA